MADGKKICSLLFEQFPSPEIALNFSSPLELLIATILSAQCTDKRVNIVTKPLFERYRTVDDYSEAELLEIEQYIHSTGFYRNKAKSIKTCCQIINKQFKGSVPSTMEDLLTLPGVGRKTANVVLGAAFGIPSLPVDTHVIRVSNRLGLADSKDPDKIELQLMKQVSRNDWMHFATSLILHGRQICKAIKPECGSCYIYSECEWKEKPDYS
ncbi:MAG: endonuclease III [Proteobacteria bacterium]|nr:endonuclease III [Pseudomonadota bacterium]